MQNPELDLNTNSLLYDLQSKGYEISFETHNKNYCEVFQRNKKAKQYNYSIGNHLYCYTQGNPKLSKIFTKFLCDHINNCFDHSRMYPKYIEMGYSPSKFVVNGIAPKATTIEVDAINLGLVNSYLAKSIDVYIGTLISILADHVENDYQLHHRKLIGKTVNFIM